MYCFRVQGSRVAELRVGCLGVAALNYHRLIFLKVLTQTLRVGSTGAFIRGYGSFQVQNSQMYVQTEQQPSYHSFAFMHAICASVNV